MKLRHRIYVFWLDNSGKFEGLMLAINLALIPIFLILYWLGLVPFLPFGGPSGESCGSGPYKWDC